MFGATAVFDEMGGRKKVRLLRARVPPKGPGAGGRGHPYINIMSLSEGEGSWIR